MNLGAIGMIVELALLGLIFYFLLIRPENKRRKAVATMQSSLEKGESRRNNWWNSWTYSFVRR